MATKVAGPGQNVVIQDAATTGNGDVVCPAHSIKYHTFYVVGNGTIGAGAITFETAPTSDYAGTWAALPDYTDPTNNDNPTTVVSSAAKVYTIIGQFPALRARISTTVTTTSVTVTYVGGQ